MDPRCNNHHLFVAVRHSLVNARRYRQHGNFQTADRIAQLFSLYEGLGLRIRCDASQKFLATAECVWDVIREFYNIITFLKSVFKRELVILFLASTLAHIGVIPANLVG
jgi:hypothetical protein